MRLAYYLYSGWQVFVRWLYSALSIYSLTWTPCVRPNLAHSSGIQLGRIPALLRFAYCIPAREWFPSHCYYYSIGGGVCQAFLGKSFSSNCPNFLGKKCWIWLFCRIPGRMTVAGRAAPKEKGLSSRLSPLFSNLVRWFGYKHDRPQVLPF